MAIRNLPGQHKQLNKLSNRISKCTDENNFLQSYLRIEIKSNK